MASLGKEQATAKARRDQIGVLPPTLQGIQLGAGVAAIAERIFQVFQLAAHVATIQKTGDGIGSIRARAEPAIELPPAALGVLLLLAVPSDRLACCCCCCCCHHAFSN